MRNLSDTFARLAAFQQQAGFTTRASVQASGRLVPFEGFGNNPGALDGHHYIPPGLTTDAPLVVALHGCTQNAAAYDDGTGWSLLAEQAGFALLVPGQRRANNANLCFNWFEPADIARTGGEAESIAQMTEAMVATYRLDRRRVFATGLSAGGAMTAVMLATYPDLFAAGAIIAGLPYGGATGVAQALDRMRGHGAQSDGSAATIANHASAGVAHRLPAVAIWQGGADSTVVPSNAERLAGQWRGVHGLGATPSETRRGPNWEHRVWRDADARAAIELWNIAGMGHGVPIDPSGPARLGRAGPYMLDVGLSSTHAIAESWGLVAAGQVARPVASQASAPTPAPAPASSVQDAIQTALRSAGLLR